MLVSLATSPAGADGPNEDFVAAVPGAVVLLDGAGLSGAPSACRHGVAWYTRHLGTALIDVLSKEDDLDLRDVLGEAITAVAADHGASCDIADPSSPSSTVVMLRLAEDRADFLVLADSVLVLDQAVDAPAVITDDREAVVGRQYRAAMDEAVNDTAEHSAARRAYVEALRSHRNRPGGFWVAADDPKAAAEAITGSRASRDIPKAALLSDGASRLADRFGLVSWAELLTMLDAHGPAEVIRRVRDAEASDPHGDNWPRGKTRDDATIAYCTELVN